MTREEFNKNSAVDELKKLSFSANPVVSLSDEDYAVIEFVYTWHPSISETNGKKEIALLYAMFGMRIIYDMLPSARRAEQFEKDIASSILLVAQRKDEYERFKKGVDYDD